MNGRILAEKSCESVETKQKETENCEIGHN